MEKRCEIYFARETYFAICKHRAETTANLVGEPMKSLSGNVSDTDLGNMILSVANESKEGLPLPKDPNKEMLLPMLKFIGYHSWKKLEENTYNCDAKIVDSKVIVTPGCHSPERGYRALPKLAIECSVDAPDEIGRAVREAIRLGFENRPERMR